MAVTQPQNSKEAMKSDAAPPPGGSYSQAIRSNGILYVSGQTPRDTSRKVVAGSIKEQTRKTLENVSAVVAAGGATLADAVKVTVYLQDWSSFEEVDEVYAEFFPEPRPARTTIQSNIPVPVEIDVTLHVGTTP